MAAKAKQSTRAKKPNKPIIDERSVLKRPTTWVMAVLLFALLFVSGLSIYGLKTIGQVNRLESTELTVFPHIAKMYIKDMEFEYQGQPTVKQATGYGVSDENGVLYITFDFAPYTVEDNNRVPSDYHHAIIYFQKDDERKTYGHAFSYHEDASYHPDGLYVRFEE